VIDWKGVVDDISKTHMNEIDDRLYLLRRPWIGTSRGQPDVQLAREPHMQVAHLARNFVLVITVQRGHVSGS